MGARGSQWAHRDCLSKRLRVKRIHLGSRQTVGTLFGSRLVSACEVTLCPCFAHRAWDYSRLCVVLADTRRTSRMQFACLFCSIEGDPELSTRALRASKSRRGDPQGVPQPGEEHFEWFGWGLRGQKIASKIADNAYGKRVLRALALRAPGGKNQAP